MGYYVSTIDVNFTIKADKSEEAYKALCELNNHNELKRGGRFPSEKKDGPHDGVWFSWMDWNYPETCPNLETILQQLGFETDTNEGNLSVWGYDSKSGNEDLFLEALAPFVEPDSYIEWRGECGAMWRNEFDGKAMTTKTGVIAWI